VREKEPTRILYCIADRSNGASEGVRVSRPAVAASGLMTARWFSCLGFLTCMRELETLAVPEVPVPLISPGSVCTGPAGPRG
jgi:hypothetical protein